MADELAAVRTFRLSHETDDFIRSCADWRDVSPSQVIRDGLDLLAVEQALYLLSVDAHAEPREGVPREDVLAQLAARRGELVDEMFGERVLG